MKKFLIAFAAIALSATSAYANSDFDGLYLGANGAYSSNKVKEGNRKGGFAGEVISGYGITFDNMYVGAEAHVGKRSGSNTVKGIKVKQNHNYGITGRVGVLMSPKVLTYGAVGYERASLSDNAGGKAKIDGIKFGVGGETFVKKNLTARSEFSMTKWNKNDFYKGGNEFRTTIGLAVHF